MDHCIRRRGLRSRYAPVTRPREFFDLADADMLNGEARGQPGIVGSGAIRSTWGNLGDWHTAATYPAACAALASRLGRAAGLTAVDRVFDAGFGCGDQLQMWWDDFGVRELAGANLSVAQTARARARMASRLASIDADAGRALVQGDAVRVLAAQTKASRDVVMALDCAYHFHTRQQFFAAAARAVPVGGRLALADIVVGDGARSMVRRARLGVVAQVSRMPAANLVTTARYRQQLADAGWRLRHWDDITTAVFAPFRHWLDQYRVSADAPSAAASQWWKYQVTASTLLWAQRHDVLRFVICVAERSA